MSSKLRCTACLRACRSSCVVFSSSTDTRRPRSAIKSMVVLLNDRILVETCALVCVVAFSTENRKSTFPENALAPRPALPHAKLEDRQIGGFQEPACDCHDF